jgi:hypothetical protein
VPQVLHRHAEGDADDGVGAHGADGDLLEDLGARQGGQQRRGERDQQTNGCAYGQKPPSVDRCSPDRDFKMVVKVLLVYWWQLPEQSFSSGTVYRIVGESTFLCESGLKRAAWQPAQSGLYAANGQVAASLFVVWQLAQVTLELCGL